MADDFSGAPPTDDNPNLLGLGAANDLIRQQIAQAIALGQRPMSHGYGALGGIAAGLENAARGFLGYNRQNSLNEKLQGGLAKQADLRNRALQSTGALDFGGPGSQGLSSAPQVAPASPAARSVLTRTLAAVAPSTSGASPDGVPAMLDANPQARASLFPLALGRSAAPAQPQNASASVRPGGGPQPTATLPSAVSGGSGQSPAVPGTGASAAVPASSRNQSQPADPLAEAARRDFEIGARLEATGDPVLSNIGEARIKRSQMEQQLDAQQGFEGRQADLNRKQQQEIAMRPQFHPSPYTGGAFVFDPATGGVRSIAGLPGGAAGPGGVPGTPAWRGQVEMMSKLEDAFNPLKLPASENQDLSALKYVQSGNKMFELHPNLDFTPSEAGLLGEAMMQVFGGTAGTEGELNSIVPKSMGGNFASAIQFVTGHPEAAASKELFARMRDLLQAEGATRIARIGSILNAQQQDPYVQFVKKRYPDIYNQALQASLMKRAALLGAGPAGGAPGTQPSAPGGNVDLSQPAGAGSSGMVDVISPEGTRGQIPAASLDAALKRGFTRG